MKAVNLSEWAVKHGALWSRSSWFWLQSRGCTPISISGAMKIRNSRSRRWSCGPILPGATIEETTLQLTDRIEKKVQETPSLDYIKSYTLAGETTIFVNLLTSTDKKDVPDIWYQVRKKVGDIKAELPSGTIGPFFNDEFGDTYGIIYAFTSDGFSHRELKDYVETVRDELLHVADVAKVAKIGFQDEKVYIEFSSHQLANLGISRSAIMAALQEQNILTPSGVVDTGKEQVIVEATGKFGSDEDLKNVTVYAGSKKVRLVDIATINHGYSDPPQPRFRYNGADAIGLAVSMRKGGDVLALEKNVAEKMASLARRHAHRDRGASGRQPAQGRSRSRE